MREVEKNDGASEGGDRSGGRSLWFVRPYQSLSFYLRDMAAIHHLLILPAWHGRVTWPLYTTSSFYLRDMAAIHHLLILPAWHGRYTPPPHSTCVTWPLYTTSSFYLRDMAAIHDLLILPAWHGRYTPPPHSTCVTWPLYTTSLVHACWRPNSWSSHGQNNQTVPLPLWKVEYSSYVPLPLWKVESSTDDTFDINSWNFDNWPSMIGIANS